MKDKQKRAIFYAVLAAVFYALNAPASKILLKDFPPAYMAGFLYLGAGLGMSILGVIERRIKKCKERNSVTKSELPYVTAMIMLDVAAPILLMAGLSDTTAETVSLLNNFEIVATALIAGWIFREKIAGRLWVAIVMVTAASIVLSVDGSGQMKFTKGAIMVLLACICWGFENNCTRKLSVKNPLEIVVIKGLGSGTGSLLIAMISGEHMTQWELLPWALLLGFTAYGLSIFFYVYAQRWLGAAKTSAYYAISPFIGVALSWMVFREKPTAGFIAAIILMALGTYFASTEEKGFYFLKKVNRISKVQAK